MAYQRVSENVRNHGAVGDGVTNDSAAFTAAIAAAEGSSILVPHSVDGNYLISDTVTSGVTVNWIMDGGVVEVTGSLTINGGVTNINFHTPCFKVALAATSAASLLKIRDYQETGIVSRYTTKMSPMWFDSDYVPTDTISDIGTDIGIKVNKCFTVGGQGTVCEMPAGRFLLSTSIIMDQTNIGENLVLRGQGLITTSLFMPRGQAIIGVNADNSGEAVISDFRLSEADWNGVPVTGTHSCAGIRIGGTSCVVKDVWIGNTKYGIVINGAAGAHVQNVTMEQISYGLFIASIFADFTISGWDVGGSITECIFEQISLVAAGDVASSGDDRLTGLHISAYQALTVSSPLGNFIVGETITGSTSGTTAIARSWNTPTDTILMVETPVTGGFIMETITGGTSGAAANVNSVSGSSVRHLQFTDIRCFNCDRHGAEIDKATDICISNSRFENNGIVSTAGRTSGMLVWDQAEVLLTGCSFYDNDGTASNTQGLDITGIGTKVTATGCSFGSSPGLSRQDYGVRVKDAAVILNGCSYIDNNILPIQDDGARLTVANSMHAIAPNAQGIVGFRALDNSGTPSVLLGDIFLTGGTATITDFDEGLAGQKIIILSEHAITITDGANISLAGSADFVMASTDSLQLVQKADGNWYEIGRSVN